MIILMMTDAELLAMWISLLLVQVRAFPMVEWFVIYKHRGDEICEDQVFHRDGKHWSSFFEDHQVLRIRRDWIFQPGWIMTHISIYLDAMLHYLLVLDRTRDIFYLQE